MQLALDWMNCSVKKRNREDQRRGFQCLSQLTEVHMTIVITYLAKDNAKTRYRARRAAKREQAEEDARLARKIAVASAGCSLNVARATSAPSLREKHESTAMCLPQVALFQAGHRKVRKEAVHIIK